MKPLFELSSSNEPLVAQDGNSLSLYLNAHYQKVAAVRADMGRLPDEDEFFFLQSDNSYNAFTFIPFALENQNARHLYCTTYSINKRVIHALTDLHKEGKVDRISLLVSDTMLSRNPTTVDELAAMNKEYPNIEISFTWVHAKVCLIQTDKAHYVIEGSGNWSENAYYEQYFFANSIKLFDFRLKLFTESKIRYRIENGKIL
jgi:hypothetical protein